MKLGILLTTSPEHQNSTTALCVGRAALELGHEVELFLMDDGVYNVLDSRDNLVAGAFAALQAQGAAITLCGSTCDPRGVTKESAVAGVVFGSQYDHAQILHRTDRFLVFG
ncbi:MAG TPA: DsrE family protein [Candidatus Methylomirabilis sp.]|nr:DsrE family protein [Candidatus Methylomirabilis sp.]